MGGARAAIVSHLIGGLQLHSPRGRRADVSVKKIVNRHRREEKVKRQGRGKSLFPFVVLLYYICVCVCVCKGWRSGVFK